MLIPLIFQYRVVPIGKAQANILKFMPCPSSRLLLFGLIDKATSQSKPSVTFESKADTGSSLLLKESGRITLEIALFSKAPLRIDSTESGTAKSEIKFPANARMPMVVRDSGKLNPSRSLLEKEPSPISVTELGRVIFLISLSAKMNFSIEVKEFEILASVISLSQNAFLPIDVTESGMSMPFS